MQPLYQDEYGILKLSAQLLDASVYAPYGTEHPIALKASFWRMLLKQSCLFTLNALKRLAAFKKSPKDPKVRACIFFYSGPLFSKEG